VNVKETLEKIKEKWNELKDLEKQFKLVENHSLQETSGGTYFLCLPKTWIRAVGLQKGKMVTIVWLPDDSLSLTSSE